jgi:hypothetical protein
MTHSGNSHDAQSAAACPDLSTSASIATTGLRDSSHQAGLHSQRFGAGVPMCSGARPPPSGKPVSHVKKPRLDRAWRGAVTGRSFSEGRKCPRSSDTDALLRDRSMVTCDLTQAGFHGSMREPVNTGSCMVHPNGARRKIIRRLGHRPGLFWQGK